MGETESNNDDIISAIDNPDSIQQNNKLESSNDEAKDNNQQKSPGSYFDLKYKHFGFGGPNNKDNNSFNGNKLKYSINEEKKLNNQSDEIEGEREENEEDRLFTRVANWFKQNAAEILTKGKDFFSINKKKDKKSEDGQETIEN